MQYTLNGIADDSIRDVMVEYARKKREEWLGLMQQRREVDLAMARLQEQIESMNPFLASIGLEQVELQQGRARPSQSVGTPGNRSEDMPKRRELFGEMTLKEAVELVLEYDRDMHADEIGKQIYEVKDQDEVRRVKQTLVSTLLRGAHDGWWEKTGPNRFRGIRKEREQSTANEPALALA